MKFLLDQDVYAPTARFLRDLGHDVLPVAQVGLSQAGDEELFRIAQEQNRIFDPRQRFRNPCVCEGTGRGGTLRMLPSTQNAVHGELERVLETYTERERAEAFIVIEPGGYRIRRLARE